MPDPAPAATVTVLRDAAQLDHVAEDVFDHPVDARWMAAFLDDPSHHMLLASIDRQVVGMISAVCYVHPDKAPELWINEVGVTPAHQRRGIGTALVRAMLDHARGLGCREAWLGTESANVAARGLYARVGGREQAMVAVTFEL